MLSYQCRLFDPVRFIVATDLSDASVPWKLPSQECGLAEYRDTDSQRWD